MKAAAVQALAAAVIALLAFATGLWSGRELATAEHDAQRTRELSRAFERYQEQVAQGEATAEQLHISLLRLATHHATVTGALRHAPLLARTTPTPGPLPVCPAAAAPAPAAAAAPAAASASDQQVPPGEPAGELAGAAQGAAAAEGPGLSLTLAAVSLWNSALAGAHVPAGACRTDGPASAACAAAAGTWLDEVWANHTENARRCAVNAAQHRALLEHVTRTQTPLPTEPRR